MLEYADLKTGETLYDLGSGDGRIVFMAVQEFGAQGIGIENDRRLFNEAIFKSKELGLNETIKFIHDDIFNIDLSPADVVTLFLTVNGVEQLRPKLERELKPETRVVSYIYPILGWNKEKEITIKAGYSRGSYPIYLYRFPQRG